MKKKTLSLVLSLSLAVTGSFGAMTTTAYGTSNGAGEVQEDTIEIERQETTYIANPDSDYISSDLDYDVPQPNGGGKPAKASYPSLYPTRGIQQIRETYPPTRKQSPWGTCWAFAVTACAEFDMVKNHGQKAYTYDLSELQLAYYTYHTGMDRLGLLDGDKTETLPTAEKNYLDRGGNAQNAVRTLAAWKGYTYETSLPYSYAESTLTSGLSSSYAYLNDGAKLEKSYILDIKNNPSAVKDAIMTYGAVSMSYNYDTNYYNAATNGLYVPKQTDTNHSSAIVGWDDNFSASNFKTKAPGNGAWLVRNSGTTDNVADKKGYFWLSYYDSGLTNSVFVVDMMPASRYTHNYQYDGIGSTNSIGVEAAANVFTAQNKNGAASERLDAVTVSFMRDADVNYQIEIYTNLTDPTNPEKGYLHKSAITTGKLTYPGIYTIPLKNSVYLAPGEKFSVVVKSLDGDRWFNCEESHTYPYGVQATAHADKGESFYKGSLELTTWKDVAEDKYPDCGNMCIKALTNDSSAKKYMVTYNLDGGTNDDSNPISFLSTQSGSYTLQNPTRSGYHFLGWYADAACTQQVTTIDYNAKEDKTLYAKWCADNSAPITEVISRATFSTDGSAHVTCSGCGKDLGVQTVYRVDSVKLDSSKPTYTGENVNPVPVIKDSKGNKLVKGEDYTYSYSKSSRKSTGRYYVTVTFKNRYSGSKKLYFTVVPKAPSSASAKLYGYNDVKVSWKKSAGASGYHVYYKKTTSKSYSKYKSTTKLNVKFSNLNGNVKYNFKIVPYYKSGDKKYESTKSKVVSATTLKKLAVPKMKAYSYTRAYLSWECISGASGYQTAWSKSKNGTYKQLCDYGSRYSNINFTVGRGVSYWYKVRAYKTVDGKKIYGPWSEPKQYALK